MVVGEDQGVQEVQEVEVDGGDDGVVDDQRVLAEAVVVQKDLVVEGQRAEVGEVVQNAGVVGCQRVGVEEEVAVQKDLVVEEVQKDLVVEEEGVYGMSFSLKP
jgi:predicted NUDIX family NTP pyrophosphohydrolase